MGINAWDDGAIRSGVTGLIYTPCLSFQGMLVLESFTSQALGLSVGAMVRPPRPLPTPTHSGAGCGASCPHAQPSAHKQLSIDGRKGRCLLVLAMLDS